MAVPLCGTASYTGFWEGVQNLNLYQVDSSLKSFCWIQMKESQDSRKKTGEFYTPFSVVDFMIQRISYYLKLNNKLSDDDFVSFSKTLSELRFCDPSIGTGNFFLGLLKWIWNELRKFDNVDGKIKVDFFKEFATQNIYGIELNPNSLAKCKHKIKEEYGFLKDSSFSNLKCGNSIVDEDAYDMFSSNELEELNPLSWGKTFKKAMPFDVVIGNPPYFNLKKMETRNEHTQLLFKYLKNSEHWKDVFRASSDIYYFFILQSLRKVNVEGLISLIIPNYWLENKYADRLRENLLKYQILEIIDLGGINVFKDEGRWLNVSTCILTAANQAFKDDLKVSKSLPRNFFDSKNIREKSLAFYSVKNKELGKEKWILSPHFDLIKNVSENTNLEKLEKTVTVAQGLSPGVKEVFVKSETEFKKMEISKDVIVPFISNRHIKRWKLSRKEKMCAILPSRINDLSSFPNLERYLTENRTKLTTGPDRKRLLEKNKIRWFDFSVYRNLEVFEKSKVKIVCPYRSLYPRFSYDDEGHFGATDMYALVPNDKEDILSLLGVLNSSFTYFWFLEAGKRKGKMLEFFSSPLRLFPVPKKENRRVLIEDVQQLIKFLSLSNQENNKDEVAEIERRIDCEVASLYGISISFLDNYVKKQQRT